MGNFKKFLSNQGAFDKKSKPFKDFQGVVPKNQSFFSSFSVLESTPLFSPFSEILQTVIVTLLLLSEPGAYGSRVFVSQTPL